MFRCVVFAALVAGALSVAPLKSSELFPTRCGRPKKSPSDIYTPGSRIVNGKIISEQSWPWLCAMINYQREEQLLYQFCGSTLINRQWILTASHCVDSDTEDEMKKKVKMICGQKNLLNALKKNGQRAMLNISRVIKHKDYDVPAGTTNNDIALIKLAEPIPDFTDDIHPACLPTRPVHTGGDTRNKQNNRRVCFVGGYGHLQSNQQATENGPQIGAGSDDARQVDVEVYTLDECKRKMAGYYISDKMICAGFDMGGKDSCQGDSGGPFICSENNTWVLYGDVSWGAGCADAGKPGIYANVHAFKDWIAQTMKENL